MQAHPLHQPAGQVQGAEVVSLALQKGGGGSLEQGSAHQKAVAVNMLPEGRAMRRVYMHAGH